MSIYDASVQKRLAETISHHDFGGFVQVDTVRSKPVLKVGVIEVVDVTCAGGNGSLVGTGGIILCGACVGDKKCLTRRRLEFSLSHIW